MDLYNFSFFWKFFWVLHTSSLYIRNTNHKLAHRALPTSIQLAFPQVLDGSLVFPQCKPPRAIGHYECSPSAHTSNAWTKLTDARLVGSHSIPQPLFLWRVVYWLSCYAEKPRQGRYPGLLRGFSRNYSFQIPKLVFSFVFSILS